MTTNPSSGLQLETLCKKPPRFDKNCLPKKDYRCRICRKLIRKAEWHSHHIAAANPNRSYYANLRCCSCGERIRNKQGDSKRIEELEHKRQGRLANGSGFLSSYGEGSNAAAANRCRPALLLPLPKLLPERNNNIEMTREIRRLREGWKA